MNYKMNREEKHLTIHRYATLTSIILFLLVMLFFILDLESFVRKQEANTKNRPPFLETSDQSLNLMKQVDLAEDVLFIHGKELETEQDLEEMREFIAEEKVIVFLNLPEAASIENYQLDEVLGIDKIEGKSVQKELNLVPGFLLGGLYQLEDLTYHALDLDLSFSTKVYAYGEKTAASDWPIIWRNTYKGSEIYTVNGPFMETNAFYGILSGILAEVHEDYLYPIVNARLMVYENFPYLSYENQQELEANYNRDAMKLQHDILFPDLLSMNKLRGFIPNGFFRAGFAENATNNLKRHHRQQLETYQEQLFKDGGEIGLSDSGAIQEDQIAYERIFGEGPIQSVLVSDETTDLEAILQAVPTVEAIIGPFQKEKSFAYLNEQAVYLPFTAEGFEQSGQDELEFISMVTAFGTIIHNLNIEEILQSANGTEKWTGGQKAYAEFLDKHREKFSFLKNRNVTETSDALKVLLNQPPKINKNADKIHLHFPTKEGQPYYILRTNKKIQRIENAHFKEIEENAYLIQMSGQDVTIQFSPVN